MSDTVKKTVRSSTHTVPFTASFSLKSDLSSGIIFTAIKPEYLNCRALSPRRLDVHGAFTVTAKIVAKSEKEILESIKGDDIQAKTNTLSVTSLCGINQQQYTVTDHIGIGSDKPPIEAVLRTQMQAVVSSVKPVNNKLMIKGDINIRLLYLTDLDTGATEVMEYAMPFNQILDVEGVTNTSVCNVWADVLSYNINVVEEMQEKSGVEFDIKLVLSAAAFENEDISAVTDAYSTQYDIDLTYEQTMISCLIMQTKETCVAKATVEIGGSYGISRVIDLWCDQCTASVNSSDGQLTAKGKATVCVLALNNESVPFFAERTVDYTYPLGEYDCKESTAVTPNALATSVSYRINGSDSLDLRIEIKLDAPVFQNKTMRSVCSAQADEEHLRLKDNKAALTLYYAHNGESVWNIAREYAVSCDAVMTENDITDDLIIQGKMLLIPNI